MPLQRSVVHRDGESLSTGKLQRLALCDRRHCLGWTDPCANFGFRLWARDSARKSAFRRFAAKIHIIIGWRPSTGIYERAVIDNLADERSPHPRPAMVHNSPRY